MCNIKSSYANNSSLGCGCGCKADGLSGASEDENNEAKKTKDDLVKTAKDYINDEIPTRFKIGAVALLIGSFWISRKCT